MFEQIWVAHCNKCGGVRSITSLGGQRLDACVTTDHDRWIRCWTCGMVDARRTAGVDDQVIRRLILDGASRAFDDLDEIKKTPTVMRPGTTVPEDWSELLDERGQYGAMFAAFELDGSNPEVREHALAIVRGALDEMCVAQPQTVGV